MRSTQAWTDAVIQSFRDVTPLALFLSDHEKQQNQRICVCVSRVVGDITLDSGYRAEA
jgi:hypothetical protein